MSKPLEKEKPRAGHTRPGLGQSDGLINYPHYSTVDRRPQAPLHSLIDQALSRFDDHTALSRYYADLSDYHRQQAESHRRILHSLEKLIPSNGGQNVQQ